METEKDGRMETTKTWDEFIARQVQAVLEGKPPRVTRKSPYIFKSQSNSAVGADISDWPALVEQWLFGSYEGPRGPWEAWYVDPESQRVLRFFTKIS